MKRRILASLLSLVMMLSLLPTAAWATDDADEDSVGKQTTESQQDADPQSEDDDSGKGSEAATVTGPQWNFAPQHTDASGSACSYYYNSSWKYDVEGYPGEAGYGPKNAISLRSNSLPTEVNALIEAVEEAKPTTYTIKFEIATQENK